MFVAKEKAPYTSEQESRILVQPEARVSFEKATSSFTYSTTSGSEKIPTKTEENATILANHLATASTSANTKVGVDVEEIASINISNEVFVERNFTREEQRYCNAAPSPQASFAGRWCAKEAVFKSLGVASKGAGASLLDIEITNDTNGAPIVTLHNHAAAAASEAGVTSVSVSISHSDSQAIAIAISSL